MNTVKIIKWMKQNVNEHRDNRTGEINTTSLAEAAAEEFELYEDNIDYNIPEEVFELSAQVCFADELPDTERPKLH